jgi:serine/threonine protein kinase/formylglycine-generating enzyme required for sulfatase activity
LSQPNHNQRTSVPAEPIALLERICDQFEAALKAGDRPRIELYLETIPEPPWSALLRELLVLELAYRGLSGDRPTLDDYLARFPGQEDVVRAAFSGVWSGDSTMELHPRPTSAAPARSPERIGRYRIERLAGRGGFGLVYAAQDEQLNRPVAIKVPHARLIGRPEDARAYLEEARIVASLDHPHIVPVYDVGSTEEFPCFVVSKFIDGENLAVRIKQERPTSNEAAELVAMVAGALHYAHARGLVHRDIKPGNILIDVSGRPFVTDFGLALDEEHFGKRGALAGTPAYMSPEQAKGEGHRVDGRSDIFSLGVVFYELLTGRRPFVAQAGDRDKAPYEFLDLIATTEARPPRHIDDTIPEELERICLKAMSKRAADRFTTARDMAEDLSEFLKAASGPVSPVTQVAATSPRPGSTRHETPVPSISEQSDSEERLVRVVPKGLRSFGGQDADFFLELLPGPRDRHGLPESIRFWKSRIDTTDSDQSFSVGLIFGPSGCGKSSLVKAGLLPRLGKHVLPVYVEATLEATEIRILKGLRKVCPDLPATLGLVGSLASVRKGRILRSGQKVLVVVDQFEQWLHARRGERDTELVAALRQCDGEHVQAVVMVRDDFWLAVSRFLADLEVELVQGQNTALVDLFDVQHARKVLRAFGTAYGKLPARDGDLKGEHQAFLNRAISELAQDGKVISVRLALFAEMVKGKLWAPATLREVGGAEGVGITFLEETFGSTQANPRHRLHQNAAQAVLKALLPETGTDIKGRMKSEQDLMDVSGYAGRPKDLQDLLHILDNELRLITPTDAEGVEGGAWRAKGSEHRQRVAAGTGWPSDAEPAGGIPATGATREPASADRSRKQDAQRPTQGAGKRRGGLTTTHLATLDSSPATLHPSPATRYYQLTHDYLVHPLRVWLTRKQRETRRGRAALRLAERSSFWNSKPENRHLPSPLEWANIRLFTRKRDWTASQRNMMNRSGRLHGLRALGLAVLIALVSWATIESYGRLRASALVESLKRADTSDVPSIVAQLSGYRRWADPQLAKVVRANDSPVRERLHASLALLPIDATQVDYLFNRLLSATPSELKVLRDALRTHRSGLTPQLWAALESAMPGDATLLPSASALASYDPENAKWDAAGGKVAQALVSVNSLLLLPWTEALRPVRGKLTAPIAMIFQDKSRSETVHSLATDILADYASEDPDLLGKLLMVSDDTAYRTLFPVAEKKAERVLPTFRAELEKKATYSWNDSPLDEAWIEPATTLVKLIESAQGILMERFAFCQTMPMGEFLASAEALRKSGYRPVRFRPYADGMVVRVAAVWTRDGRNWQISSGLTADEIRQQDERSTKVKLIPVDVAGYVMVDAGGKPANLYAGLWVEKADDDDARMYVGLTTEEGVEVQGKLEGEKLIARTLHAMVGSEGSTKYCGVWGRPPRAAITGQTYQDQFQGSLEQKQADLGDQLLLDIVVSGPGKPKAIRERARADLEGAQKKLMTKPDDPDARLARAMANFRLGENQKALDDLQFVIGKNPESVPAKSYKVIALARLGKKQDAQSEVAKYQKEEAPESSKLHLATVVAAEVAEGLGKALEALEVALKKEPTNAELRYDAARAVSLASHAVSRTDKTKGRQLAGRCLQLLREAVKNGDSDFGKMDEDADLDPIRDTQEFAEIMTAAYPDRRYGAVWSQDVARFEAVSVCGQDPATHLQKCRELIAQGYRPVSLSLAVTASNTSPAAASVWHRPVVKEETKDQLAERQARAAVALARMGKAGEIWSLLQHSADPRLRSFIIDWLKPLGANPKQIGAQLDQIDLNAEATPARGEQKMDAILFHPETSMRRALILTLGTYGTEELSPGEREPLIAKLLDLYRSDPDAGIHAVAEWTLRQWNEQAKLKAAEAKLPDLKHSGSRRWFVNSHGQTFVLIEGPVEFTMGSPPTELEREPDELVRRRFIPRRFAIATKEVTFRQYQEFMQRYPEWGDAPNGPLRRDLNRYGPDPDGPIVSVSWFGAVAYCNWLSKQEGMPEEEWCYVRNSKGEYSHGMMAPADALNRRGYRLPAEAEWEYACRAGASTSRYYGPSLNLLPKYARYAGSSADHAWLSGSLRPNDLGLFDMLGNVFEWCHGAYHRREPKRLNPTGQALIISSYNSDTSNTLVLRGGAFYCVAADVRSANRYRDLPTNHSSNSGFRLARTCD